MKHLRATPKIEIPYLIGAMSECDKCRDSCSGAGASDIIEIVAEDELWILAIVT